MARPKKQISEKQVTALARIGCTVAEIASIVDCKKRILELRFLPAIETGRVALSQSLKRKQVTMALKGDRTMLIWLGKQYLGQREKHEVSGPDGEPLGVTQVAVQVKIDGDWYNNANRLAPAATPAPIAGLIIDAKGNGNGNGNGNGHADKEVL